MKILMSGIAVAGLLFAGASVSFAAKPVNPGNDGRAKGTLCHFAGHEGDYGTRDELSCKASGGVLIKVSKAGGLNHLLR